MLRQLKWECISFLKYNKFSHRQKFFHTRRLDFKEDKLVKKNTFLDIILILLILILFFFLYEQGKLHVLVLVIAQKG